MLAGVEQVVVWVASGLGGSDAPDPGGAVADVGELADVFRAAADAFGLHQVAVDGGGLEGGDDAGGAGVPDWVAAGVQLVLGVVDASLTSRVRARPSSPSRPGLPSPWRSSDAGAINGGVELVRQRRGRERHQFPGGDEPGALSPCGGHAAPLASASLSTRLTVSQTPARSASSPAAPLDGTAAAARSFIAARLSDMPSRATPSSASRGARPCPQSARGEPQGRSRGGRESHVDVPRLVSSRIPLRAPCLTVLSVPCALGRRPATAPSRSRPAAAGLPYSPPPLPPSASPQPGPWPPRRPPS